MIQVIVDPKAGGFDIVFVPVYFLVTRLGSFGHWKDEKKK
jgi:hypothetical protein